MVTKQDVTLADSIPALLKAISVEQKKTIWERLEEEKRREEFNKNFWMKQGSLRKMQQEVDLAGAALQRIRMEVPRELHLEYCQTQAELRSHGEELKRTELEVRLVKELFESHKKDGIEKGMPMEKHEIEAALDQINARESLHKLEISKRIDIEARVKKAQTAFEAAVQAIRKSAK
jgi:hypothetical protein